MVPWPAMTSGSLNLGTYPIGSLCGTFFHSRRERGVDRNRNTCGQRAQRVPENNHQSQSGTDISCVLRWVLTVGLAQKVASWPISITRFGDRCQNTKWDGVSFVGANGRPPRQKKTQAGRLKENILMRCDPIYF